MAISTYSELQDHIKTRLGRSDIDDFVPDFIVEAENRIAAAVSLQAMETDLSLTLSETRTTELLPTGFMRLQGSLFIFDDDTLDPLTQYATEMFNQLYPDVTGEGKPTAFYVSNDGYFSFNTTADEDYTLSGTYYKMLTLSDSAPTNWILTNYPMALVYGAMFEAYLYVDDDPRTYAAMFDEQIAKMRRYNNRRRNRFGARVFTQVSL